MPKQRWKLAAGFEKLKVVCYQFIQRGEGKKRKRTGLVHYEGSLENGKVLTLLIQEKPIDFTLAKVKLLKDGMKVLFSSCDKAAFDSITFRLWISWVLVSNSTKCYLIFDVELMDVK
jgi:FKBP-type peptidyl-prolyl cis-trans isomerase